MINGKISDFTLNNIYQIDCIKAMQQLPDNSFDICIADPPYNVSKGNNWKWDNSVNLPGMGGNWSKTMADWDDMPLGDYFSFCVQWLSQVKRVIKPTGSIWIHGTYHNIGIINFAMQLLEIEIINEIIWYKRNSFPNLSGRRLTASHETILWAHTGSSKKRQYNFNFEFSKAIVYPEDKLKKEGVQMRTVWDIPNNKKKEEIELGKHPTQKPERVLQRMLKISAKNSDKLLVPFAGSGADCVIATKLGIEFLGFELDKTYIDLAKKKLLHAQTLDSGVMS